ncbi:MAG: thermonuclease family protein [Nitrospira sp.]|nr:thermonuclease family protein [Nitrospira sp.]
MAIKSDARSSNQIPVVYRALTGLIAAVCLLTLWASLSSADFSGRVIGVSDGDTVDVLHDRTTKRIRLNAIDCPEKGQPFGTVAKRFTAEHAFGKTVTIREVGIDKYGRTIGDVMLPDGRVLNHELLKAGLAWWYRKYSKDFSLGDLEDEARLARRGLWIDPDPIPPGEWRKRR